MNTLFVSPSYRCNENCIFCPRHKISKLYKPIPLDIIIKSITDAIEKKSIEMILISGGEPTLYKDLTTIITTANQLNLKIGILSNSLKFADNNFCKTFIDTVGNNFELTTAFHSHIAEEHDKITGVKGSFDKSLKGVYNLINAEVRITIKYIINGISFNKLPEFIEWVYNSFPDSVSLVLCNMDLCGEALNNSNLAAVPFNISKKYVENALDVIIQYSKKNRLRNVSVFNTPLCCIDPYYWTFLRKYESEESMAALLLPSIENQTNPIIQYGLKGDGGANFSPCTNCAVKNICPGTWRKTAEYFGNDIFKPFK
ncbi:MAG: radical SAM protein [Clostridia bacterium]|nr:radical SAM protein [Clostridia bacterium]